MRTMFRAGVLLLLVAVPTAAFADIYMWRDGHGVSHYTNSRALVPADANPAIILEEPPVTAQAAAPIPAPAPPPQAREEVVYDQNAIADAYAEGWQRAMASTQQMQGGGGAPVTVQINGPLVAGGGANNVGDGGYWDPSWLDYNYPALVTTSFDRGRSRHLTLRMLMQDQFAIDREGPYLIVDRFPPLGPNLRTIMPNGLPFFVRPGSGFANRVITH